MEKFRERAIKHFLKLEITTYGKALKNLLLFISETWEMLGVNLNIVIQVYKGPWSD